MLVSAGRVRIGELIELAMRRVEKRVKPRNWKAFQLTTIEGLSGADAAERLQMPVAQLYVAKNRVQKLLQEEILILRGECPHESDWPAAIS